MPLIADGDTGFGGLANVRQAVRAMRTQGPARYKSRIRNTRNVAATRNRKVISTEDMVRKIELACETRQSDAFLIVARTDARTEHGLDEALSRAEAYRSAGADVLFVESPESLDEMRMINEQLSDTPTLANMVGGGKTPMLADAELRAWLRHRHSSCLSAGRCSHGHARGFEDTEGH